MMKKVSKHNVQPLMNMPPIDYEQVLSKSD